MMIIESPNELGFKFDCKYSFSNCNQCVLTIIRRNGRLYPGGFIYEFREL